MLATALLLTLGSFTSDARLLDADDLKFAQVTAPPLLAPAAETAPSTADSSARLETLRALPQPSLVGPIVCLSSGVGLVVASVFFFYVGAVVGIASGALAGGTAMGFSTAGVLIIIGFVALVPAVVLIVAGAVWLGAQLRERKARNREIRTLEQQLQQPTTPAVPTGPPPTVMGPQPAFLLASF